MAVRVKDGHAFTQFLGIIFLEAIERRERVDKEVLNASIIVERDERHVVKNLLDVSQWNALGEKPHELYVHDRY